MESQLIFFSYSRLDAAPFALRLAEDLKKVGANIWIDQLNIQGGKRWDTEIQNALKASQCVLFIASEKSVQSDNVLDEVSYALNNGKKVLPLIISNCEIPYRISRLQHIDFTKSYETGFSQLQIALNTATETNKIISEGNSIQKENPSKNTEELRLESRSSYPKDEEKHLNKKDKNFLLIGVSLITVVIVAILALNIMDDPTITSGPENYTKDTSTTEIIDPSPIETNTINPVIKIDGSWHDPNNPRNGSRITQNGNTFQFNNWGVLPQGVQFESTGKGTITGQNITTNYNTTYANGQTSNGICSGTISPDGSTMTLTCTDNVLGTFVSSGVKQ